MPLAFTSAPATVGEASRPLAAPFWAGAPRTPTKSDADADADYIGGAGRSPSSLSPIPEEPQERRRLSPTYEAGTPPPEGLDGPDARRSARGGPLRPSPAGRVGPGGAGGVRGTLRRN